MNGTQQFPHYTWGYIALFKPEAVIPIVPSLYVRVYRLLVSYSVFYVSSLTIREGISATQRKILKFRRFPHYTWGYIDKVIRMAEDLSVPSLYVRVYRYGSKERTPAKSSLTIREGISRFLSIPFTRLKFPHYTWGYIALKIRNSSYIQVPSLYVRVYRNFRCRVSVSVCSLTIREGISKRNAKKKTQKLRSLIICEGILVIFASFRIPHIKNVKIFQKNTKKGSQKYE